MKNEMLELDIGDALFHVDVVLPTRFSKDQKFSRFISNDLLSVLDLLLTHHPAESRVTMQSGFVDGEGYVLRKVSRISSGTRQDGGCFYICEFDNDQFVIGEPDEGGQSAETKLLWPRSNRFSWESLHATHHMPFESDRPHR